MAVFRPVVQALVGTMFETGCDFTFGRSVGSQLVCDDPFGQAKPLDQRLQKTLCGTLVASGLQDFLQNKPVLIDRAPEPELPPRYRYHNLIEMPDIAGTGLASTQIPGNLRGKFRRPTPDRLIGNVDATVQEYFLDLA